jgi:hypothetical protein
MGTALFVYCGQLDILVSLLPKVSIETVLIKG